jgi:soluble lytic murein transglycosylase-like protein
MNKYEHQIRRIGRFFYISPVVIQSLIRIESNFKPGATRYEPEFFLRYIKDSVVYPEVEWKELATSWGLMQIMGVVAREQGYSGALSNLLIPEVNLYYGVSKLSELLKKYLKLSDAVSAYNQGNNRKKSNGEYENQAYVDKFWFYLKQDLELNLI